MSKCCLLLLFLAAFLLPAASAASCHLDDLRALRGFMGNLSGGGVLCAAWSGASCCSWEGVRCDGGSGRVTTLSLPGRDLAGPIPGASLTGLARLESLNLANNNRLVGTITSWIGELHHLCHLDLSHTSLVGEVPKSLQIRLTTAGRSLGMAFTNMPSHVKRNRRALGGQPNTITGTNNVVISGTRNVVSGNHNTIISGNANVVSSSHSTVTGSDNAASGNHHVVFGKNHVVTGSHNTVSGSNNAVSGNNHLVSGKNHVVSGSHNTVSGSNNIVSGSNHVVFGSNKVVT